MLELGRVVDRVVLQANSAFETIVNLHLAGTETWRRVNVIGVKPDGLRFAEVTLQRCEGGVPAPAAELSAESRAAWGAMDCGAQSVLALTPAREGGMDGEFGVMIEWFGRWGPVRLAWPRARFEASGGKATTTSDEEWKKQLRNRTSIRRGLEGWRAPDLSSPRPESDRWTVAEVIGEPHHGAGSYFTPSDREGVVLAVVAKMTQCGCQVSTCSHDTPTSVYRWLVESVLPGERFATDPITADGWWCYHSGESCPTCIEELDECGVDEIEFRHLDEESRAILDEIAAIDPSVTPMPAACHREPTESEPPPGELEAVSANAGMIEALIVSGAVDPAPGRTTITKLSADTEYPERAGLSGGPGRDATYHLAIPMEGLLGAGLGRRGRRGDKRRGRGRRGGRKSGTFDDRVKIGRNVPCPCGSGRKYKNCCGRSGRR